MTLKSENSKFCTDKGSRRITGYLYESCSILSPFMFLYFFSVPFWNTFYIHTDLTLILSTAGDQAVACAPVTQWPRVRSPVGTSFLGEVFSGFLLTCKTNVGKLYAPKVPEYHLTIIIIIIHRSFWASMTWDVDAL